MASEAGGVGGWGSDRLSNLIIPKIICYFGHVMTKQS